MTLYTQANRPITVTSPLGGDVLIVAGIEGEEGLSTPYAYTLDLRSENDSIKADDLLRKPVCVTIHSGHGDRLIHGLVRRFVQAGQDVELTAYRAEVVPWLWFLSLWQDCRIFQQKTVPDIVKEVFSDVGFSDYKFALMGSYPVREYCVQYRESHLDFVSRLLEEEGIFYYFEHTESKHTLVVTDQNSNAPMCAMSSARVTDTPAPSEETITALSVEYGVHSGDMTLKGYDYLQPSFTLMANSKGKSKEAVFDYPVWLTTKGDVDQRARLRLESAEALGQVIRGESICRAFQAGTRFSVEQHYRGDVNTEYLMVHLKLTAEGGSLHDIGEPELAYTNEFVAIPSKVPYKPYTRTPRPIIAGSQTAVVVGKSGEEIWVDSHGRVKVQFHWDRQGKLDENSSCWVRVSTSWAGKGWGAIQIPRIGQEVVVDFLEGDPDRPLITGSVYNAEQVPPYALPDNQTQSGVRSRSSKGGGTDTFNEILLEDKKGEELFSVQAQKDMKTLVKNDETREVQHDRATTIKNDETRTVKEGKDVTVIEKGDQSNTVKQGNQSNEVTQGKQTVKIHANQETTIEQGDQIIKISMGKRSLTISQGNEEVTLQMGNRTIKLALGNLTTKLDLGAVSYEAMQGIELKVGQSSIKVDQMGVTIKGMMIQVQGQVQTQIKGLMTQVNGDAMLMAKGGITMIG